MNGTGVFGFFLKNKMYRCYTVGTHDRDVDTHTIFSPISLTRLSIYGENETSRVVYIGKKNKILSAQKQDLVNYSWHCIGVVNQA